jgi:hypothetical protein
MLRYGIGLALVTLIATSSDRAPVVAGLDHVPIAVARLDEAAADYRALGFTLKPGRPHDNGIRNQHAKFADGTELELITAAEARDGLTTTYRRHLAQGDGPAFLALFSPDLEAAAARLQSERAPHRRAGPIVDIEAGGLEYLFLGRRNASPTDRAEHFAHANGATSLVAVWLAGDLSRERSLFEALGARRATEEVRVPDRLAAPVARFAEGAVVMLPAGRQLVPGRKIVGVTLRVRALAAIQGVLGRAGGTVPERVATADGASVFIPPDRAHGLWIEFRETQ